MRIASYLAIFAFSVARAQSVGPPREGIVPSPSGLSTGGIFGDAKELAKRHIGFDGKPCIVVEGATKSQTINPNIMEHWVNTTNNCGQHIKVTICYYNTQHCVTVDVPAWGRKGAVLGIFPTLREFRYEYTEQF
jgi:hypothetical protein